MPDKTAPHVHQRPAPRKTDRRVRRTRDKLGDAMIALLQERPFDAITVQAVLARAGVSRSAFYEHYRDKTDLFLSDVEEFFEAMATYLSRRRDPSTRVAPVREFFEHVAEEPKFYAAMVASGKFPDVMELGQGHFARGIAARLAELPQARGLMPARRAALARALSGALLSLLTWWVDRGSPETAAEMDAVFHELVWRGVTGR